MNLRLTVALTVALAALSAAEDPRQVPQAVAEVLTQAANASPAEALTVIDHYRGPPHALILLARAQACWHLAQDTRIDADRARRIAEAETGFHAAMDLDAGLKPAYLGLAQCAAAREDWRAASRFAASGLDPSRTDAGGLGFIAQTALRAGDWRLATLAVQHGILRFPDDDALRRIEVTILVHAGRGEDARQALLALLAQAPGDVELWRNLAWAAHDTGRDDEALGALEAALAAAPDHRDVRRQLAEAQLGHGLPQAALATIRPLMGDPPTAAVLADEGLMLLASRAAADGGDLAQARTWLAAIPDDKRSRSIVLQQARVAVQAGDPNAARAHLDTLIAGGEQAPNVLTWAASLAEQIGDQTRAEALYLQAIGSDKGSDVAPLLRLVALYLRHHRQSDAMTVLATYLNKHPDDVQARAMLVRISPH